MGLNGPVTAVMRRIISNLNSKDKVDIMIFKFSDCEPVLKFNRESDWGCLCDGRYLLLEQIEMWSEISDIEPRLGKYL